MIYQQQFATTTIHLWAPCEKQDPALHAMRTLGQEFTWKDIEEELDKSFGVKETYQNFYHQAVNLKNHNVNNYFHNLRNIFDKLNAKYEQDARYE